MTSCTKCGAEIPREANFCGACGRPVVQQATETSPQGSARSSSSVVPSQALEEPLRRNPLVFGTNDPISRSDDWSIWASVTVVLVVFFFQTLIALYEGVTPIRIALASALGASMVPIVIGGLVGFFIGRSAKNKQPNAGFASGTTIVFVFGVLGSFGGLHDRHEEKQQTAKAINAIREDVNRGFVAPAGAPTALAPPVPGDMGELQKFLRAQIGEFQRLQQGYRQELHGIGWETVLNPDRIRGDVGLRKSQEMVTQAKQIVQKYAGQTETVLRGLEAKIQTLAVSEDVRRSTLTGFRNSMAKGNRSVEVWRLEAARVEGVEKIISLLQSSGNWTVENGQVAFESAADLARFNEAVASINLLRKQEAELRKDAQADVNAKLDSAARDAAQ